MLRRACAALVSLVLLLSLPLHAVATHAITVESGQMGCAASGPFAQPAPGAAVPIPAHEQGLLTIRANNTNLDPLSVCLGAVVFLGFTPHGLNPSGSVTQTSALPCLATTTAPCQPYVTLQWDVPFSQFNCGPMGCVEPSTTGWVEIRYEYQINGASVGSVQTITLIRAGPPTE